MSADRNNWADALSSMGADDHDADDVGGSEVDRGHHEQRPSNVHDQQEAGEVAADAGQTPNPATSIKRSRTQTPTTSPTPSPSPSTTPRRSSAPSVPGAADGGRSVSARASTDSGTPAEPQRPGRPSQPTAANRPAAPVPSSANEKDKSAKPSGPSRPSSSSRPAAPAPIHRQPAKPAGIDYARNSTAAKKAKKASASLNTRRTLIPPCLVVGTSFVVLTILFFLQPADSAIRRANTAVPITLFVVGLLVLGLGVLNMLTVKKGLEQAKAGETA